MGKGISGFRRDYDRAHFGHEREKDREMDPDEYFDRLFSDFRATPLEMKPKSVSALRGAEGEGKNRGEGFEFQHACQRVKGENGACSIN
jgi:hypothetical protein